MMRGLACFLDWGFEGRSESTVRKIVSSIDHRGSYSYEIWPFEETGLVLGHRRLPVLDLNEAVNVPMASLSGQWARACNGEICNQSEQKSSQQGVF